MKLEEVERLKVEMERLSGETQKLTVEQEQELLSLGRRFPEVWNSKGATPALKKRIIRIVIEEIVVDLDEETEKLIFTVHWKGGTHTQFRMTKPVSGSGQKTAMEDIEIIRKMGVRYGDDEIARVLNKLERTTGKGNRWNEQRVATVPRRYQIAGHHRKPSNPELLTLEEAAAYCGNAPEPSKPVGTGRSIASARTTARARRSVQFVQASLSPGCARPKLDEVRLRDVFCPVNARDSRYYTSSGSVLWSYEQIDLKGSRWWPVFPAQNLSPFALGAIPERRIQPYGPPHPACPPCRW